MELHWCFPCSVASATMRIKVHMQCLDIDWSVKSEIKSTMWLFRISWIQGICQGCRLQFHRTDNQAWRVSAGMYIEVSKTSTPADISECDRIGIAPLWLPVDSHLERWVLIIDRWVGYVPIWFFWNSHWDRCAEVCGGIGCDRSIGLITKATHHESKKSFKVAGSNFIGPTIKHQDIKRRCTLTFRRNRIQQICRSVMSSESRLYGYLHMCTCVDDCRSLIRCVCDLHFWTLLNFTLGSMCQGMAWSQLRPHGRKIVAKWIE